MDRLGHHPGRERREKVGLERDNAHLRTDLSCLKKRVRKVLKEMHLQKISEGNEVDNCPLCQLYLDCKEKP